MRHLSVIILLLMLSYSALAWKPWPLPMDSADIETDTLYYGASISGVFAGNIKGEYLPDNSENTLWLMANTDGDIVNKQVNAIVCLQSFKQPTRPHRWWDYSYGVQINGRATNGALPDARPFTFNYPFTAYFQQLYAHCRLYIFDITAGIKSYNTTFGAPQLSVGSLLFSNNAHPIPRISIGIDRWTAFPLTYGYLEIKAALQHGWINSPRYSSSDIKSYYLHYKYAGARIGGKLPINISYEFHHAVQWGGLSAVYGDLGNDFNAFKNIFLGRSGGTTAIETNNIQGNHLCMQQVALELKFKAFNISAYWQVLQDDGPINIIGKTMNRADGLWGVNINQYYLPYFQSITYEYISTTEQSGPVHDIDGFIFGGRDDYYSHSIYTQGWTYFGRTIGNPLLTPSNNRVRAHHIAIKGDIQTYYYRLLCTHAQYYTPYAEDLSFNQSKVINYKKTSLLLEITKKVPQLYGITFSAALAADIYDNHSATIGGRITICKIFDYQLKKKSIE